MYESEFSYLAGMKRMWVLTGRKPPANFPPVYTEEEADVKIVT
jgi:hypothetical protein